MNEEIFKKVTAVIVDKLGVKAEDVKPESEFGNDLGDLLENFFVHCNLHLDLIV